MREGVGINELQNFGKYRHHGCRRARLARPDQWRGASPSRGGLSLTPMLSERGRIIGDFTPSACLSETEFQLTAGYGRAGLPLALVRPSPRGRRAGRDPVGPPHRGSRSPGRARAICLAAVTRSDVSAEAFRFMDVRRMSVGLCDAIVQRVSYTGDSGGYEIYVDAMGQRGACGRRCGTKGQEFGIKPFGMRAMMSLRLDRAFGSWMRE